MRGKSTHSEEDVSMLVIFSAGQRVRTMEKGDLVLPWSVSCNLSYIVTLISLSLK
jgi:hypothetical protein